MSALPVAHHGCMCDCHRMPGVKHVAACCFPDAAQPLAEGAHDTEQKAPVDRGSQVEAMGHSVSPEDRQSAAEVVAVSIARGMGVLDSSGTPFAEDFDVVDALIGAGWGPVSPSPVVDREALIALVARIEHPQDWTSDFKCQGCATRADKMLSSGIFRDAAVVAQAERERCAQVALDHQAFGSVRQSIAAAIRALGDSDALAAMLREAKAEAWDEGHDTPWDVEPDPSDPSGMTPMQVPPINPYREGKRS